MVEHSQSLPWFHILQKRRPKFDPSYQPELDRLRITHFFGQQ
ncbi:MAG: hypothetical protein N2035_07795 [Chthoniobacterales bacterium]|nr:hypothetical protein [Chthoniobacterales bacterium]